MDERIKVLDDTALEDVMGKCVERLVYRDLAGSGPRRYWIRLYDALSEIEERQIRSLAYP